MVYWIARSFPSKIRLWNIQSWTQTCSYRETRDFGLLMNNVWCHPGMFSVRKQIFKEIITGIYVHQSIEC